MNYNKLYAVTDPVSFGLLVLRWFLGVVLFAKHGLEKIVDFEGMERIFPDPLWIGPTAGLCFALVADGICSLLLIVGAYTGVAVAIIAFNMTVVFTALHRFAFIEEHAEVVFLYLAGSLCLAFTGPGRYSLDQKLLKRK